MTAWLGSLGAMVPVGPMARLAPDSSRARTFTPTVGGGMTSRQAVRSFRKWSAATSAARTPDQLANLAAFEVGGYGAGPWWLVDEWAQVTNVLCPWDSELMTPWLSTVSGGPQWLGGDVYAGRS
ncbi:MAG TPA: hypothetical protein VFJ94_10805, partial [Intrasporangium sp.]|uniref:hypothetical protein n=1 Tax=Intrasporangium sp. TaxID=1925024 RepID=UPI002D79F7EA